MHKLGLHTSVGSIMVTTARNEKEKKILQIFSSIQVGLQNDRRLKHIGSSLVLSMHQYPGSIHSLANASEYVTAEFKNDINTLDGNTTDDFNVCTESS